MAEFDTIPVHNPLEEEWMVRYNGEPYVLKAKETKYFPVGLAFHIAKHLSEKLMSPELLRLKATTGVNENPLVGQLIIYDNPSRRIALFDILGKKDLVESCIRNTNLKGFIGEMSVYDEYVAKKTGGEVKPTPVVKAEVPPPPPPAFTPPPVKEPEKEPVPPVEPPKEEPPKEPEVPPAPSTPQGQTARRGRPSTPKEGKV